MDKFLRKTHWWQPKWRCLCTASRLRGIENYVKWLWEDLQSRFANSDIGLYLCECVCICLSVCTSVREEEKKSFTYRVFSFWFGFSFQFCVKKAFHLLFQSSSRFDITLDGCFSSQLIPTGIFLPPSYPTSYVTLRGNARTGCYCSLVSGCLFLSYGFSWLFVLLSLHLYCNGLSVYVCKCDCKCL